MTEPEPGPPVESAARDSTSEPPAPRTPTSRLDTSLWPVAGQEQLWLAIGVGAFWFPGLPCVLATAIAPSGVTGTQGLLPLAVLAGCVVEIAAVFWLFRRRGAHVRIGMFVYGFVLGLFLMIAAFCLLEYLRT
jgi:hypothetical protein